jgi:hypothetical protein
MFNCNYNLLGVHIFICLKTYYMTQTHTYIYIIIYTYNLSICSVYNVLMDILYLRYYLCSRICDCVMLPTSVISPAAIEVNRSNGTWTSWNMSKRPLEGRQIWWQEMMKLSFNDDIDDIVRLCNSNRIRSALVAEWNSKKWFLVGNERTMMGRGRLNPYIFHRLVVLFLSSWSMTIKVYHNH